METRAPTTGPTPGPWEVEFDEADEGHPIPAWIHAPSRLYLFQVDEGTEADARLAAAAPDLLDAAQAAVEHYPNAGFDRLEDANRWADYVASLLHEAIEKATGGVS